MLYAGAEPALPWHIPGALPTLRAGHLQGTMTHVSSTGQRWSRTSSAIVYFSSWVPWTRGQKASQLSAFDTSPTGTEKQGGKGSVSVLMPDRKKFIQG